MFAMFFFLSQFIQNVMGYSPAARPASRSCRSASASSSPPAISSNLVDRIDPRFLAGIGTLMAGAALFGFSRLPYDDSLPRLSTSTAQLRHRLLPFIVLMSLGMGMTFVPLTLTAVHHVRARGLRHRLRRAEHHAAGRRRARPRHPVHGGRALHLRQGRLALGGGPVRGRRHRRPARRRSSCRR